MNPDHVDDLAEYLSQALLGSSYDPDGYTPEHIQITRLTGMVQEHDVGNVDLVDLREAFSTAKVPQFDFDLWLTEKVAEGVYPPSILEDDDEGDN